MSNGGPGSVIAHARGETPPPETDREDGVMGNDLPPSGHGTNGHGAVNGSNGHNGHPHTHATNGHRPANGASSKVLPNGALLVPVDQLADSQTPDLGLAHRVEAPALRSNGAKQIDPRQAEV